MYTVGLRDSIRSQLSEQYTIQPIDDLTDIPNHAVNDYILVDSSSVATTDLYDFILTHRDHKIIYIVDEITNSIKAVSTSLKMPVLTPEELSDFLYKALNTQKSRPIVTFFGVLPRLGTTTIALAVATKLQTDYSLNVGLLGLNLYDPGTWMIKKPLHHLDDLQSFLAQRHLTPQMLLDNMFEMRTGVKYLLGNRNPSVALEKYQIPDIAFLIEQAEQAFDVVILDAGSVLNTAASLQALLSGTLLFSVITDRIYAERQFNSIYQHILKPLEIRSEDILLVGSMMKQDSIKTLNAFAQSLRVQPTGAVIPEESLLMYQSEQADDPIAKYLEPRNIQNAISNLSEMIATTYGYRNLARKPTPLGVG